MRNCRNVTTQIEVTNHKKEVVKTLKIMQAGIKLGKDQDLGKGTLMEAALTENPEYRDALKKCFTLIEGSVEGMAGCKAIDHPAPKVSSKTLAENLPPISMQNVITYGKSLAKGLHNGERGVNLRTTPECCVFLTTMGRESIERDLIPQHTRNDDGGVKIPAMVPLT